MLPDGVIDQSQRFSSCSPVKTRAGSRSPAILMSAAAHLERFAAQDPRQRSWYALWRGLLDGPVETIVAIPRERSPRGDYKRETAPVLPACPSRPGPGFCNNHNGRSCPPNLGRSLEG